MVIDVVHHNRRAGARLGAQDNRCTKPGDAELSARARAGDWRVVLTPKQPVPRQWFGDLKGARVLGLASGGGQQCPVLAAAGAHVTVFDNSPAQLEQDRTVAAREGLELDYELGDMADLSAFSDGSFDLIFHPVSNCFVADVRPVWKECARVLRPGGALLAGLCNPLMYLFDEAALQKGTLQVRHELPYSDLTSITADERRALYGDDEPLSFGHTLTDQLGGQLDAGLVITAMFEDRWGDDDQLLDRYTASFIATRAVKAAGQPPT